MSAAKHGVIGVAEVRHSQVAKRGSRVWAGAGSVDGERACPRGDACARRLVAVVLVVIGARCTGRVHEW